MEFESFFVEKRKFFPSNINFWVYSLLFLLIKKNFFSFLVKLGARLPGGNVLSEDEQDGKGGTSDDEMMSDSESSIASLTDRKKSFEQTMDDEMVILAEAVWDHIAIETEELAFRAGDVIDVMDTMDKDWWWGSCRGKFGWFPAAFVRVRMGISFSFSKSKLI